MKIDLANFFVLFFKVRGTVYGVFTFLEDYLGCRFYAPEIEIVPERDRIEIPDIDDIQTPDFEYRMVTYMHLMVPKLRLLMLLLIKTLIWLFLHFRKNLRLHL